MAQSNVDPERVIQTLSAQVGQLNLENTMLRIALEDANTVITKQAATADKAPAADGT